MYVCTFIYNLVRDVKITFISVGFRYLEIFSPNLMEGQGDVAKVFQAL